MFIFRCKCFWSKGKEGVYMVSLDDNELLMGKNSLRNCVGFYNFDFRGSIGFVGSIVMFGGFEDVRSY